MTDNSPVPQLSEKKKLPIKLIFVIIILGVFVGVFLRTLTAPPQTHSENSNRDIPHFKLVDMDNPKAFITHKDIQENAPVLVNIWASWCAPCRNEHKIITELATKHNVKIFGLNYKDTLDNGQKFLKQHGNPYFKTMNDADGIDTLNWGIRGVPETFVINKQGKIIHRHTGEVKQQDIEGLVKKLHE